jgi:hypothetical protein
MCTKPLTLDGKKLDIKTHLILVNIKDKIYLLLSKGVIRKALANFNSTNPEKMAVLTSIKTQSQSFKYKKHAEYSVNSLNYIISIFTSRKESDESLKINNPKTEGEFFKKIQEKIENKIKAECLHSSIINDTIKEISEEFLKTTEMFNKVHAVNSQNVEYL